MSAAGAVSPPSYDTSHSYPSKQQQQTQAGTSTHKEKSGGFFGKIQKSLLKKDKSPTKKQPLPSTVVETPPASRPGSPELQTHSSIDNGSADPVPPDTSQINISEQVEVSYSDVASTSGTTSPIAAEHIRTTSLSAAEGDGAGPPVTIRRVKKKKRPNTLTSVDPGSNTQPVTIPPEGGFDSEGRFHPPAEAVEFERKLAEDSNNHRTPEDSREERSTPQEAQMTHDEETAFPDTASPLVSPESPETAAVPRKGRAPRAPSVSAPPPLAPMPENDILQDSEHPALSAKPRFSIELAVLPSFNSNKKRSAPRPPSGRKSSEPAMQLSDTPSTSGKRPAPRRASTPASTVIREDKEVISHEAKVERRLQLAEDSPPPPPLTPAPVSTTPTAPGTTSIEQDEAPPPPLSPAPNSAIFLQQKAGNSSVFTEPTLPSHHLTSSSKLENVTSTESSTDHSTTAVSDLSTAPSHGLKLVEEPIMIAELSDRVDAVAPDSGSVHPRLDIEEILREVLPTLDIPREDEESVKTKLPRSPPPVRPGTNFYQFAADSESDLSSPEADDLGDEDGDIVLTKFQLRPETKKELRDVTEYQRRVSNNSDLPVYNLEKRLSEMSDLDRATLKRVISANQPAPPPSSATSSPPVGLKTSGVASPQQLPKLQSDLVAPTFPKAESEVPQHNNAPRKRSIPLRNWGTAKSSLHKLAGAEKTDTFHGTTTIKGLAGYESTVHVVKARSRPPISADHYVEPSADLTRGGQESATLSFIPPEYEKQKMKLPGIPRPYTRSVDTPASISQAENAHRVMETEETSPVEDRTAEFDLADTKSQPLSTPAASEHLSTQSTEATPQSAAEISSLLVDTSAVPLEEIVLSPVRAKPPVAAKPVVAVKHAAVLQSPAEHDDSSQQKNAVLDEFNKRFAGENTTAVLRQRSAEPKVMTRKPSEATLRLEKDLNTWQAMINRNSKILAEIKKTREFEAADEETGSGVDYSRSASTPSANSFANVVTAAINSQERAAFTLGDQSTVEPPAPVEQLLGAEIAALSHAEMPISSVKQPEAASRFGSNFGEPAASSTPSSTPAAGAPKKPSTLATKGNDVASKSTSSVTTPKTPSAKTPQPPPPPPPPSGPPTPQILASVTLKKIDPATLAKKERAPETPREEIMAKIQDSAFSKLRTVPPDQKRVRDKVNVEQLWLEEEEIKSVEEQENPNIPPTKSMTSEFDKRRPDIRRQGARDRMRRQKSQALADDLLADALGEDLVDNKSSRKSTVKVSSCTISTQTLLDYSAFEGDTTPRVCHTTTMGTQTIDLAELEAQDTFPTSPSVKERISAAAAAPAPPTPEKVKSAPVARRTEPPSVSSNQRGGRMARQSTTEHEEEIDDLLSSVSAQDLAEDDELMQLLSN